MGRHGRMSDGELLAGEGATIGEIAERRRDVGLGGMRESEMVCGWMLFVAADGWRRWSRVAA